MSKLASIAIPHPHWSGTADLRTDGGLILRDLRHDGYSFATEVRVLSVMLSAPDYTKTPTDYIIKEYVLGEKAMPAVSKTIDVVASPLSHALIDKYKPSLKLGATFKTKDIVFGKPGSTIDSAPLTVEQMYYFTDYGKSPPHEPGGVLPAARFYPVVRFEYDVKPEHTFKPEWIRIDYRIAISVDLALKAGAGKVSSSLNQAGVFLDADKLPSFPSIPGIKDIFDRAEKPLANEIVGYGFGYFGKKGAWDNVHQWGTVGTAGTLPSTPGAFHCAHSHWRWGAPAVAGYNIPVVPKSWSPLPGNPIFEGVFGRGSPILDPAITNQRLDFAVVKDSLTDRPELDGDADPVPTEVPFSKLFTDLKTLPLPLASGAPLAQFYAFKVKNTDGVVSPFKFAGSVFVHGYFFAHEPEAGRAAFQVPLIRENKFDPKDWQRT